MRASRTARLPRCPTTRMPCRATGAPSDRREEGPFPPIDPPSNFDSVFFTGSVRRRLFGRIPRLPIRLAPFFLAGLAPLFLSFRFARNIFPPRGEDVIEV